MVVLVARPLVGGEFPGLQSDLADPGSMALTFFSLFACAAWAGWRLLQGASTVYLGWADLAVIGLVAVIFLGTGNASYPRPALLAGWDWLSLGLLFVLVRQLAVRPEEKHGLVAVLLAGAVALSAEGIYQGVYAQPREGQAVEKYREEKLDEDALGYHRTELMVRGISPTPLELHTIGERLAQRRVHGPYFQASSLAAVLALAVPLLGGAFLAGWRGRVAVWQLVLAGVALLVVVGVLVLTRTWTAVLAAGAVSLGAVSFLVLARRSAWIVTFVLGVAWAGAVLLCDLVPRATEVWPSAWRLLRDHFWTGVGATQFGSFYPRYLPVSAGVKALEPGNAVLDVWADGGVLAAVALLAVIGLLVRAVIRWSSEPVAQESPASAPVDAAKEQPANWEYYVGGMVGLILAFGLRAATVTAEDILTEAMVAGLRAVVWFAAFGLFEGMGWTVEEQVGALAAGVGAMFLTLLTVPGIDYPSVAYLFWIGVALLLCSVAPAANDLLSQQSALRTLAAPVLLATAFGYFAFFFYPTAASASALHRSRLAGVYFLGEMKKAPVERGFSDPFRYIRTAIIEPVEKVYREDPENVRLMNQLAVWYGQLWALAPNDESLWKKALSWSVLTRKAAPESPDGYFSEFDLRRRIATVLTLGAKNLETEKREGEKPHQTPMEERKKLAAKLREDVKTQHNLAIEVLTEYLPRDPNDPQLHYLLAAENFEVGRAEEGRRLAERAHELNEQARPPRKLPDQQREQVEKWLRAESKK